MRILAILLIVVGAIGLIWGGVTYVKDRDSADLGGVEITVTDTDRIAIPPIAGAIFLVGGLTLYVVGSRWRQN